MGDFTSLLATHESIAYFATLSTTYDLLEHFTTLSTTYDSMAYLQVYPKHESKTYFETLYYTKMIQRHILPTNPQHVTQRHVLPSTEWYLPTARFLSVGQLPLRTSHRRQTIFTTGWCVTLSPTFCYLMPEGITSFLR